MTQHIFAAARECAAYCHKDANPHPAIDAYILMLITDLGWARDEAEKAGQEALRLLREADPT